MLIRVSAVHYDFYKRNIDTLVSAFPDVFNRRFPPLLAIGIHHELASRTEFSPEELSAMLRIWTNRIEYHAMGCSIGARVDLDGNITQLADVNHVQRHIFAYTKMGGSFIKRFAKHFLEVQGRPAFLAVPISQRKEINFGSTEESEGSSGSTGRTSSSGV